MSAEELGSAEADVRIFDYIKRDEMDRLVKGISQASRVAMRLTDVDGNTICGPYSYTQLCRKFNYSCRPDLCAASAKRHAQLASGQKYSVYECSGDGHEPGVSGAGLIDAVVPVVIEGEHVASLVFGQILFQKPDAKRKQQFEEFAKKKLGLSGAKLAEYVRLLDDVPIIQKHRFERAVNFICRIAQLISSYAYEHRLLDLLVSTVSLGHKKPETIVGHILARIHEMVRGVAGLNLWYQDGRGTLVLRATYGFDVAEVGCRTIPLSDSVCGRAIRENAVIDTDPHTDPEFHDAALRETGKIDRLHAIPIPDVAGTGHHIGAVALFLRPGAPTPSDSTLRVVTHAIGLLEAAFYRHRVKHLQAIISTATELLTSESEAFGSIPDKILSRTLPNVVGYVLYKSELFDEGYRPIRTHFSDAYSGCFGVSDFRKFCKYVLRQAIDDGKPFVCHDVLSPDAPDAVRGLFSRAIRDRRYVTKGFSVLAAPFYDDGQLMGGLVGVSVREGESLPEIAQCTILPTFSQAHIDTFQGVVSLLSMAASRRVTEEERAVSQEMQAHELIAPIHAIKGYQDNLKYTFEHDIEPNSEADADVKSQFERQLNRLGDLCSLLELIASGGSMRGSFYAAQSDFETQVLLPIVQPLRTYARSEKRASIEYGAEFSDLPRLYICVDRMKRCVFNLVENAVKYSRRYSQIEINLSEMDNSYRMAFVNEGIGVPDGEDEFIFRRFRQGSNADTVATYGAGLGLHIARHIARQHGGDVELADSSKESTTFVLELPKWLADRRPTVEEDDE